MKEGFFALAVFVVSAIFSVLSNIIANFLQPHMDKRKRLAIILFFGFFVAALCLTYGAAYTGTSESGTMRTWIRGIILLLVVVGWLSLFWIYTSKTASEVWISVDQQPKIKKLPQFPKWRKWALAGMILLPVCTFSTFGIVEYIKRRPSGKTVVAVSIFKGPGQGNNKDNQSVTDTVINRLRRATVDFPEVQIQPLTTQYTEFDDSDVALKDGEALKATVVIWGFYDDALNGTFHIELLSKPQLLGVNRRNKGKSGSEEFDYKTPPGRIPHSATIKEAISGDMAILTLSLLGILCFEKNDLEGAIERFSKALDQLHTPETVRYREDIAFFRGVCHYKKSNFDLAIKDYTTAIEINQNSINAYSARALAYLLKGSPDLAILDSRRAISILPNSWLDYYNLGLALRDKESFDEAIASFSQSINLKKDFAAAYFERGRSYYLKAEYSPAITDFTHAIGLESNNDSYYYLRGEAHSKIKDYDKALDDYDRCIFLNPYSASLYYERAGVLMLKGYLDRALSDYEQAIRLNPKLYDVYRNEGLIYGMKGDLEKAITLLNRAVSINPKDAAAYYNRGTAHTFKGNIEYALADYNQAIDLDSHYAKAYLSRGEIFDIQGNKAKAGADYQKAYQFAEDSDCLQCVLERLQARGFDTGKLLPKKE